jgi:cation:H+ antiporter
MVVLYILYLRRVMGAGEPSEDAEELRPLYIQRSFPGPHREPNMTWIVIQLLVSLVIMFAGAHMFVAYLSPLAIALHVDSLVLALLIVPVATELPEKFNSVIWVSRGKDTLALGNISGALVFQSTFPISLGLIFLDWRFSVLHPALIGAVLGLLGALIVYVGLRRTGKVQPALLATAGSLYLVYLGLIAAHIAGWIHLDVNTTASMHTHASAAW